MYYQAHELYLQPDQKRNQHPRSGVAVVGGAGDVQPSHVGARRHAQDFPRARHIGYNHIDGRLMVVVFCHPAENVTYIISFRKANDREQAKLENRIL